jgi:hypothetical protein
MALSLCLSIWIGCEWYPCVPVPNHLWGGIKVSLLLLRGLLEVDHLGALPRRDYFLRGAILNLGSKWGARQLRGSLVHINDSLHHNCAHHHLQAILRDYLLECDISFYRPPLFYPLLWGGDNRESGLFFTYIPALNKRTVFQHGEQPEVLVAPNRNSINRSYPRSLNNDWAQDI